jgi:hypothetical protein
MVEAKSMKSGLSAIDDQTTTRLRSASSRESLQRRSISYPLPFGRLWYGEPNAVSNAIDYAKFYSRSHDAVTRVYDEAGTVIETHEHVGDFKEW